MFHSLTRADSYENFREPYQLIIDKNLRSKTKRQQDDTREELSKVLSRVEHVRLFISFKNPTSFL
jgi:hypothetical protein